LYGSIQVDSVLERELLCLENLEKTAGESTRDFVVRVLKTNIIKLELKPGQCISENEIAAVLKISRTPVREAFIKLSNQDLLDIYPQKGSYVSRIDLNIVEEAKFLRVTLGKAVSRLACQCLTSSDHMELEENLQRQEFCVKAKNYPKLYDLDNEFHHLLFKACHKERIYELMESIGGHTDRLRMLRLEANVEVDEIYVQHQDIIKVIQAKDPDKAESAMENHLNCFRIEQEILRQQYPEYFKE
jgi:GntR family transcriptional regulator, rspAB operon transcriptional repressor